MALIKDLIVYGSSRVIGDSYFNIIKSGIWNGSIIGADYLPLGGSDSGTTRYVKKASNGCLYIVQSGGTIATGTASTLTSLDVSKNVIYATVTAATNISLSSNMGVGLELTVVVYNNSNNDITQPIPITGGWNSLDGGSIIISSKTLAEISILCYASGLYNVSCKSV